MPFDPRFFSDQEAWLLFRIGAFGEAVGWTLLISGILVTRYLTPGNNIAVDIAGQLHGTLFLIYLAATAVTAPSLRWSRPQTIITGLASIPPYGTLAVELWVAHQRRRQASSSHNAAKKA